MKRIKSNLYPAAFAVLLLLAGNVALHAQAAQQPDNSAQTDATATEKTKKKTPAVAATSATTPAPAASTPATTPAAVPAAKPAANTTASSASVAKPAAKQPTPPVNSNAQVWVNTESGVYHNKPGTR